MRGADRTECIPVADGVEVHALRWKGGDGAPFVLVHGLASNARLWDGVAGELARAGHPVLAVDQRGHGRSSKPDHGYDMATVAEDLRAVVEASGFSRPVLVGQSWGGNVVVELAFRHAGLVRALGCIDGGTIELAEAFDGWEECAATLRPPRLTGATLGEIEDMLRRDHPDWPDSGIDGTLASFELRDDGTVAPWLTLDRHMLALRGLWEHRPSTRLPHVREPVLVLVARDGDVTERLRDVADLDHVRIHAMEGDHDLHAQHPHEVASLLRTLAG